MTIDEAITHAREVAIEQSSIATELLIGGCDASKYIECKEGHEQIAEWLEELKTNRIALEKANGYLEVNHRLGYNKAIDDFVKEYKSCDNRSIQCKKFLNCADCVAAQLKAGVRE